MENKNKSNLIYTILIGICAGTALIAPIFFIIITRFTKKVVRRENIIPVMKYENVYIYSVCTVALIICGILFILCISSLIYHLLNDKKEDANDTDKNSKIIMFFNNIKNKLNNKKAITNVVDNIDAVNNDSNDDLNNNSNNDHSNVDSNNINQ